MAGCEQILLSGGPLIVLIRGGEGAAATAGVLFAAALLVRAPVFLFQGVAASLLANFTTYRAQGDFARLHAATRQGRADLRRRRRPRRAGRAGRRPARDGHPLRRRLRGHPRRPRAARRSASAASSPPARSRRRCWPATRPAPPPGAGRCATTVFVDPRADARRAPRSPASRSASPPPACSSASCSPPACGAPLEFLIHTSESHGELRDHRRRRRRDRRLHPQPRPPPAQVRRERAPAHELRHPRDRHLGQRLHGRHRRVPGHDRGPALHHRAQRDQRRPQRLRARVPQDGPRPTWSSSTTTSPTLPPTGT